MKAIYTRINNENDIAKYEQQLEACRSYLSGNEDILYFHDVVSGISDDAPGLSALIEAVKMGNVSHVIVASVDRLSRRTNVALRVLNTLRSYNVKISFASNDIANNDDFALEILST